jgi:cytochrome P450/NADPH-cytochrome P450 reductase
MSILFWITCTVVADRKAHPIDKKDLLTKMLNGRDPKTGQGLSDDSITKNAS